MPARPIRTPLDNASKTPPRLVDALDDPARLAVLAATGLLDAEPDAALDRFARVARHALRVPTALLSLAAGADQFLCAEAGVPDRVARDRQKRISCSLCRYVVSSEEPLSVADTHREAQGTGDEPDETDLGARAYLGVPVVVDGQVLGTLSAIDVEPREWTEADTAALSDLASGAGDALSMRLRRADELVVYALERSVLSSLPDTAVLQLDHELRVTLAEGSGFRDSGWPPDLFSGRRLADVLPADAYAELAPRYREALAGESVSFDHSAAGRVWWVQAAPSWAGDGRVIGASVVMRDVTEARAGSRVLAEREARYRLLAENSSDVISCHAPDGRYRYVSPAAQIVFGRSPEQLLDSYPSDFVHPDDVESANGFEGRVAEGPAATSTYRIVRPNGSCPWIESTATAIRDGDGEILEWHCAARDVTARRQAEEARRSSEALTETLIAALGEGVLLFGRDGRVLACNPTGERMLGLTTAELRRRGHLGDAWSIRNERGARLRWEELPSARALATGEPQFDQAFSLDRPDRSRVWLRANAVPLRDHHGDVERVLVSLTDITELRETERQARHRADHDPLTGLPNRLLLRRRMDAALAAMRRRGGHLAVVFIDLDQFKVVNDSLGHGRGDEVLLAVARRLTAALRGGADTLARFGGDEFVVLAPSVTGPEGAALLAKRLLAVLREPIPVGQTQHVISASVGLTLAPHGNVEPDMLLRDADVALYQAKQSGGGAHRLFTPEMGRAAQARLSLENELRDAIAEGQIEVHYQPVWSLPDFKLTGVEALARWRHPARGLLPPADFIPVAEQSGLIVDLGSLVLAAACEQLQRWQARCGRAAPSAAVNISARQLADPGLGEQITGLLTEFGLGPESLVLELTESTLMAPDLAAEHTLAAVSELEVRLALDDFGTGYSSLSQLRDLPVDFVKVDRSFVDDLCPDSPQHAVFAAIVALARALDIRVVAEGVETEAQLDTLRRLGCDYAQGYLLGKPMTAEEISGLLP